MGKGGGAYGGCQGIRRRGPFEEGCEAQGEGQGQEQEGLVRASPMEYNLILISSPFYRDERKEHVATSMAAKQKKRQDNITTRLDRRSDKRKGVKSKDKGRPGFEGKSFGKGKGKKPNKK